MKKYLSVMFFMLTLLMGCSSSDDEGETKKPVSSEEIVGHTFVTTVGNSAHYWEFTSPNKYENTFYDLKTYKLTSMKSGTFSINGTTLNLSNGSCVGGSNPQIYWTDGGSLYIGGSGPMIKYK